MCMCVTAERLIWKSAGMGGDFIMIIRICLNYVGIEYESFIFRFA